MFCKVRLDTLLRTICLAPPSKCLTMRFVSAYKYFKQTSMTEWQIPNPSLIAEVVIRDFDRLAALLIHVRLSDQPHLP